MCPSDVPFRWDSVIWVWIGSVTNTWSKCKCEPWWSVAIHTHTRAGQCVFLYSKVYAWRGMVWAHRNVLWNSHAHTASYFMSCQNIFWVWTHNRTREEKNDRKGERKWQEKSCINAKMWASGSKKDGRKGTCPVLTDVMSLFTPFSLLTHPHKISSLKACREYLWILQRLVLLDGWMDMKSEAPDGIASYSPERGCKTASFIFYISN